ncbi:hypothetical protein [Dinoroseobacter sp. S76]|uniref:hypothetical protein n=1 Tax=Dinoroseobacter sp. S76 TaxID=3415124 RepID=UPI003C7E088C
MAAQHDPTGFRATLGLFGLMTGLALWGLGEFVIEALGQPRLELALASAVLGFCSAGLLLSGPLSVPRALGWASLMAVVPTGLLLWASLRFATLEGFGDSPAAIVAYGVLLTVPLPFFIAATQQTLFHYPTLFNEAWRLVIRAVSAAIFLGVFWGVYMICSLLLSLVGVTLLDRLVDEEVFLLGMSGLVGGVALAVLFELRNYLSPLLLLRLLQLLLIPVTAVVLVFVVRVPLEGLDQVFSGLSAAATLLAMVFGLATLITASLDCEPVETGPSPLYRWVLQIACLLMPVLAGLGSYAVWLRVTEYGWTPERVTAACFCLLALTYAVLYAGPVVLRRNWDQGIRRANIQTALVGLALAALALTPVLNPQRISTQSQLALFEAGQIDTAQLPIRSMARDWGLAGQAGLEALRAQSDRDLQILIDDALRREVARVTTPEEPEDRLAALAQLLPVAPEGAVWPEALWNALPPEIVRDWLDACRYAPESCVAVIGEVDPTWPGPEALVLLVRGQNYVTTQMVGFDETGAFAQGSSPGQRREDPRALVRAVREGAYRLAPPARNALTVEGLIFFPSPD